MIIKKNSYYQPIFYFFTLILFVSYLKFFYLIPLPIGYGGNTNQIIPMLFTNVCIVVYFYKALVYKLDDFFSKYILFFFIFLCCEFFYTVVMYPKEPWINSIKSITVYTNFFSYFIFKKFADKNLKKFLHILIILCNSVAIIFILQALLYNLIELKFLQIQGFSYGTEKLMIRNGIRLIASDLVTFMGMLSIGLYYYQDNTKKEKRFYLSNVLITMLYCIYTTQIRSAIMGIIVIWVFVNLFLREKNKKNIFLVLTIMIVLLGGSVFVFRYSSKFVTLIIEKKDYSLYHRVDCYFYFFKCIKERPFFGNGLLVDKPTVSEYKYIVHGPMSDTPMFHYSYSDVGLVGTMGLLGILGGIFYLAPLMYCLKKYMFNKKKMKIDDTVNLTIVLIIAFSSINLSLFDAERIMILPIFMAISEAINKKLRRK